MTMMMKCRMIPLIQVLILLLAAILQENDQFTKAAKQGTESNNQNDDDTIYDVASSEPDWGVHVTLIDTAQLGKPLNEAPDTTALFVPDEAWWYVKIPESELKSLLGNMIFPQVLTCADLRQMEGQTVFSANSIEWGISINYDNYPCFQAAVDPVQDMRACIDSCDIRVSNGILHQLDSVLTVKPLQTVAPGSPPSPVVIAPAPSVPVTPTISPGPTLIQIPTGADTTPTVTEPSPSVQPPSATQPMPSAPTDASAPTADSIPSAPTVADAPSGTGPSPSVQPPSEAQPTPSGGEEPTAVEVTPSVPTVIPPSPTSTPGPAIVTPTIIAPTIIPSDEKSPGTSQAPFFGSPTIDQESGPPPRPGQPSEPGTSPGTSQAPVAFPPTTPEEPVVPGSSPGTSRAPVAFTPTPPEQPSASGSSPGVSQAPVEFTPTTTTSNPSSMEVPPSGSGMPSLVVDQPTSATSPDGGDSAQPEPTPTSTGTGSTPSQPSPSSPQQPPSSSPGVQVIPALPSSTTPNCPVSVSNCPPTTDDAVECPFQSDELCVYSNECLAEAAGFDTTNGCAPEGTNAAVGSGAPPQRNHQNARILLQIFSTVIAASGFLLFMWS